MVVKIFLCFSLVMFSSLVFSNELRLRECLVKSIRRTSFIKIGNVMVQAGVKNFPSVLIGKAGSEFVSSSKGTPEEVCKGAAETPKGIDYEIWRKSLSVKLAEILKDHTPDKKIKGGDLRFFMWDQVEGIMDSSQEEFCDHLARSSKLHPDLTKGVYPESKNRDVVYEIDATKWESMVVEQACLISLPISRDILKARVLDSN